MPTNIINDGHSTLITLSGAPSIEFCEKTVKPPGVAGGGANDVTTMKNATWRTRSPKQLKTLTPANATVAYDPAVYDTVVAQINVNQLITVLFADGSTLAFWGWLDEFEPGDVEEGSQPEADVVFIPSNQDGAGAEISPLYTSA